MAIMVIKKLAGAQRPVQSERGEMTTEQAIGTQRDGYLLAQVREAFGRVVYSHKTHEKQADLCFRKHRGQQAALIVFTAAGTGTFLAALVGNLVTPQMATLATSFVALIVTGLTLATKSFNFDDEAEAHRDIARASGTSASHTSGAGAIPRVRPGAGGRRARSDVLIGRRAGQRACLGASPGAQSCA